MRFLSRKKRYQDHIKFLQKFLFAILTLGTLDSDSCAIVSCQRDNAETSSAKAAMNIYKAPGNGMLAPTS